MLWVSEGKVHRCNVKGPVKNGFVLVHYPATDQWAWHDFDGVHYYRNSNPDHRHLDPWP